MSGGFRVELSAWLCAVALATSCSWTFVNTDHRARAVSEPPECTETRAPAVADTIVFALFTLASYGLLTSGDEDPDCCGLSPETTTGALRRWFASRLAMVCWDAPAIFGCTWVSSTARKTALW